ncbi:hypothetical protein GOP47_0001609 [Adiantum capillus-veneris]|uniref:Sodium/calcium exchanger membrane region domain-containing protein n=1 Tax=Adiantum capillus-veneris TaxID=13818 RepID=A0A9D4ZQ70_ADICA|nr:hypothetical protein GOP47_0001609 [Adiantum capillus-veneris]
MERSCSSYLLFGIETSLNSILRGFLYCFLLAYCFLGLFAITARFFLGMEAIVQQTRQVSKRDPSSGRLIVKRERLWNYTVADITLLAFGTSFPQISLATIDACLNLGNLYAGGVDTSGNNYFGSRIDSPSVFRPDIACLCARSRLAVHIHILATGWKSINRRPLKGIHFFYGLLAFPWRFIFAFVPPHSLFQGWATFMCSLIFITGISYVVRLLTGLVGCVTGISQYVIALTVLATGTSWPDLTASMIAAYRQSTADSCHCKHYVQQLSEHLRRHRSAMGD